ncbi:putative HTH domain protein [Petrocella atlantisensis]|uniref:Putative HTH domain protein n=1 Tax=Petrocella atlantisensis TaxID=2173034 RepID=A0A3P7PK17_9FIRM|nr:HTH domain-containing protein [Petrocella atlantisensis]VDN49298.1 putative HTH domain protein [Petrocella atlantisensis]
MRTSRILEMVYILLNERHQKAEELANHFGVSVKTIYRDVDTLAKAGIPISKQQGVNGGIVLNEKYAINKSKLTPSEEKVLMQSLEEIKKLPNAQLEYALKLMKQYFNEAATLWVGTDEVCVNMQEKFGTVKRATIEKNVIEFKYYSNGIFHDYRVEPYELRIKNGIWKVLIRSIKQRTFEEIYLARMSSIEIKSKIFSRREVPIDFQNTAVKKLKVVKFFVDGDIEKLLDVYPIECFDLEQDKSVLTLKVASYEKAEELLRSNPTWELITETE